jgi:putative flippase GtrA
MAENDGLRAAIDAPRPPGWRRVGSFGVVSGLSWLLDFTIFTSLCALGCHVALANATGAAVAVGFVYLRSVRFVFRCAGGYRWGEFAAYSSYQVAAVSVASWGIAAVAVSWAIAPLWAKVLVTPLTFAANYLFMATLLGRRART